MKKVGWVKCIKSSVRIIPRIEKVITMDILREDIGNRIEDRGGEAIG